MSGKFSGNEIRATFLRFFEERGHRVVRSSSLVPTNDPTLLFTNAGMNQFKDVFLGLEQRDYKTATSCQKCLRAGGKHNDLENVGFTNRHHTFFEMLGNFSFGDYFKKEAIAYAWELITSPNWFGIPKDKLYVTIFEGATIPHADIPRDDEAHKFWLAQGIHPGRISEFGMKDNFWQMGDTGPCGPCSEIFYDMGPAGSDAGHTDCKFPCDCGRYVEIWNLVFMQYNRYCRVEAQEFPLGEQEHIYWDPKVATGARQLAQNHGHGPDCLGLRPLPNPSVDTGMGLERVAAVLQGKISNFDTDLFLPLINRAAEFTTVKYGDDFKGDSSLRVIADHARAGTFLISDGVLPGRDRREYVLRKILRRAIRHGKLLDIEGPFIHKLVPVVVEQVSGAYPELIESSARIAEIILQEEKQFGRTLSIGWEKMEQIFAETIGPLSLTVKSLESNPPNDTVREIIQRPHKESASGIRRMAEILAAAGQPVTFPGEEAFKLSDTFGVPRDFIEESCRDMGFVFDSTAYDNCLAEQRTRSRASWKGAHKEIANPAYAKLAQTYKTEAEFYFGTRTRDARIEAIITKSGALNEIKKGAEAEIVLDRTSIYAESGGQVADTGGLYDNSGSLEIAEVKGAYYPVTGLIAHRIVAKEDLHVGDRVATLADAERRARNMRNHTATHLMHAALRNILGTHVKQAGSLVAPEHLRFDFSHFAAVDASELAEIEQQVNEEIRKNLEMRTDIMNIDDALASGALAFFGDKYPEANVRVVTIPDAALPRGFYSKELCGGTHVSRTGEIGVFKILSEQSVAAGVRRIDAISGDRALAEYQRLLSTLRSAAGLLNASEDQIIPALERQISQIKALEKQLEGLRRKAAGSQAQELLEAVRDVKGVRVVAAEVSGFSRQALRELSDSLRQRLGSGVIVLASVDDGKVALIAAVTKDLTGKLHAGKIIQELAPLVGGSGGGKPDLAEAGGKDTSGIEKALRTVYPLLDRLL
jgi:alanyl-tRNA synthetase